MSTQADIDNYRKVERNLQMLCVDALVDLPNEQSRSGKSWLAESFSEHNRTDASLER
jgi:hypothetical protein